MKIPKPVLKWVGGKTKILPILLEQFPTEINNYHEIFVGGGSVLLALLFYIKEKRIKVHGNLYAYDINESLIYVYKNIQTDYINLYSVLNNVIKEFSDCRENGTLNRNPSSLREAQQLKENYYYWIRNKFNNSTDKQSILHSAMFIFLNKTCFRGLFRVGPNGFNVPYGNYKNPGIVELSHLKIIHELIHGVEFKCCDFTISLKNVKSDDYVYMDPPYVPEQPNSFVKYTLNGFDEAQHIKLFRLIHELPCKFMLNNSDLEFVRDSFVNYHIKEIVCKRSINSKKPESTAKELIIT